MKVKDAIGQRKTTKVIGDVENPSEIIQEVALDEYLKLAGKSPFHYASHRLHRENNELKGIEPWRFYCFDARNCRKLLDIFKERKMDTGKIGQMLAECSSLILATWLPDPAGDEQLLFEPSLRNMEHIAATAAAINNILLAATSDGLQSYWSSGGVLRSKELLKEFEVGEAQILLGAIFLFGERTDGVKEVKGKLRELKGEVSDYSKMVDLK